MKIMTEVLIARFKADPIRQREAFNTWSLLGEAEGQHAALYATDCQSVTAQSAFMASMDMIYRDMAIAHETGTAAIPAFLREQV